MVFTVSPPSTSVSGSTLSPPVRHCTAPGAITLPSAELYLVSRRDEQEEEKHGRALQHDDPDQQVWNSAQQTQRLLDLSRHRNTSNALAVRASERLSATGSGDVDLTHAVRAWDDQLNRRLREWRRGLRRLRRRRMSAVRADCRRVWIHDVGCLATLADCGGGVIHRVSGCPSQ